MKRHEVIVQPSAQEEVNAIRIYQNGIDPDRGKRFIAAFEACLEQLKSNPSRQKRKGNYRHMMLHKLPFRVVYEMEGTQCSCTKSATPVASQASSSGHSGIGKLSPPPSPPPKARPSSKWLREQMVPSPSLAANPLE